MQKDADRKLKNIILVRNAYSWQYGGAEQFTYNMAYLLARRGIKPVVVSRVPELIDHCRREGLATFRNVWLQNENHRRWLPVYLVLMPLLVGQFLWLIIRHRAELLVVMSRDEALFGTIAARIVGIPVVWIDHADMKYSVEQAIPLHKRPYYQTMRQVDAVVVASKSEYEKIAKNLDVSFRQHFVIINNGALVANGSPLKRPANTKIVAYAGRLDRDKGLFDLIDAVAQLPLSKVKVEFWIAGKGQDETALRARIAELGLEATFKFLGHLDNVWDLLLAADVFVYPTHHDASPLAPVEALLAGVPVVATEIGGIPEVIPPSAGVLVPAHSPHELAAALSDLLTNEQRLLELKAGAKAAAPELDFDSVIERHYLPLFKRVIKEHKP